MDAQARENLFYKSLLLVPWGRLRWPDRHRFPPGDFVRFTNVMVWTADESRGLEMGLIPAGLARIGPKEQESHAAVFIVICALWKLPGGAREAS